MNPAGHPDVKPYDALLVLSFGGPEKPEDVVPFLENVTRGRGIPRERLEQVGEHYFLFGGRSPINDQNRALIAALEKDFADQGIDLPVYFGNRNWDPYLADALAQMTADGVQRAAVFATSAYSSWSSCRQYRENLWDAVEQTDGVSEVVLVPIGFVSDHMEVIYDLDTEAMATAERLGMRAVRAGTSGTDPRFVAMIRDLVRERAAAERGESPVRPALGALPAGPDVCGAGCCPNPRGPRPALCGSDS